MDNRLKEIIDNFDQMHIGVDEPFKFHCTMCGKCCINREDILLSPRDLYRVARELQLNPAKFVEQYGETYIGSDSRIPIVRLRPRGSIKRCPLLKDRKCSVHKAKPAACAMFPIGRLVKAEGTLESVNIADNHDIQYIFSNPGCGDDSETHTVREWLGEFGLPPQDSFYIKWTQVMTQVGTVLRKAEKTFSKESMNKLWSLVYVLLYLNYDIDKEFDPQFDSNTQELLGVLHSRRQRCCHYFRCLTLDDAVGTLDDQKRSDETDAENKC